jgi:hypothetical protein
MSRKGNLTSISILALEDELKKLCAELGDPELTKKKAKATENRIKEICDALYSDLDSAVLISPDGKRVTAGEHFYHLFAKRTRSSQDFIDYVTERDHVWARVWGQSARKHRKNVQDLNRKRWNNNSRNMELAREFLRLQPTSDVSGTDLKARIGLRRYGLSRSASNDAINKGLRLLDEEAGCKRRQSRQK